MEEWTTLDMEEWTLKEEVDMQVFERLPFVPPPLDM